MAIDIRAVAAGAALVTAGRLAIALGRRLSRDKPQEREPEPREREPEPRHPRKRWVAPPRRPTRPHPPAAPRRSGVQPT